MERNLSQQLRADVQSAVRDAIGRDGLVNVPHLAEMVRLRNLAENVAREDIELLILQQAQSSGVAMSFGRDGFAQQPSSLQ
jgi:hypothetical protein